MTQIDYKNIPLYTQEPRYQLFLFLKAELETTLNAMEQHGILESHQKHFDRTWSAIKKTTDSYYQIISSLFSRTIVTVNDVKKDSGVSIPSIIKNLDELERVGAVSKYTLGDLGNYGIYSKTFIYALRSISFDTVLSFAKDTFPSTAETKTEDFAKKQCTQCLTLYRKGKNECPKCGSLAFVEVRV